MTKSRGKMQQRFRWTDESLEALRALYPYNTAEVVGEIIGRKTGSVHQKAAALGLRKSPEFLASDRSGRIARGRRDSRMVATQIKPGSTPWNKGLPGSTGNHPNCRATQFKPGRAPEDSRNYLPIGTLRISKDGYLERKVTDDTSIFPARRWVAVHRLVWIEVNGSIPNGHIVVYKAGKRTQVPEEITVDRLECITRAENARRNHPRSRSPELAKLVQLKGAITRQVNRITREHKERSAL